MKTHLLLFASVLLASGSSLADNPRWKLLGLDFAAPSVSSTTDVSDKRVGMIVFDNSSGQFKGYDGAGNWNAMTVPSGNAVASSGTSERIERVFFGGTGDTSCGSSPCDLKMNTTNVSSVTRNTSGDYTINFVPGTFSEIPVCTCSSNTTGSGVSECAMTEISLQTADAVEIRTRDGVGYQDSFAMVICMGPH